MNQNKVSMKYLTAKFLQILNKKRQNLTFALPTGYLLSTLTILGIFVDSISRDNNLVPLDLW